MEQSSAVQGDLVRTRPRISVNKLGEYLVARPGRRKGILEQLKHPNPYAYGRYAPAREAIVDYLVRGNGHPDCVYEAMERLAYQAEQVPSGFEQQDLRLSVQALALFLEVADQLPLQEFDLSPGEAHPPALCMGEVAVSVRPDVVLHRRGGRGRPQVGAIKLHFSRDRPLGLEAGRYVASLTHRYLEAYVAEDGELVSLPHCLLVDVFSRSVMTAPSAYRRRRADVDAACAEISVWWPHL